MGSILSIDYGTKRIGLAVSDPSRIFAFPCGVLENNNLKDVLSNIKNIISEKDIDLIIVGMPYDMNQNIKNQDGQMAKIVQAFIKKLKEEITISVETVDERLSSFIAEERLKESGLSSKKSKKFVDEEAARLLLEEFIQKTQNS